MRGRIAWLKSPVRHRTLTPFGGITRIRFKGSRSPAVAGTGLSAIAAPPHFLQNKTRNCEVNRSDIAVRRPPKAFGAARRPTFRGRSGRIEEMLSAQE